MSFLSSLRDGDDASFGDYDTFDPASSPAPGEFLEGCEILSGADHAAFHRLTADLFEERGVYDMTFGYNLARLNLDHRHSDAGFRYAREPGTASVLRAEFTPTTEFCPQSDTLTVGAFRAWNGLSDRHEYDLVRVRVDEMHHQSFAINGKLAQMEDTFRSTGEVPDDPGTASAGDAPDVGDATNTETPF